MFTIVDVQGVQAAARPSRDDKSSLEVEMPSGERFSLPRARVHANSDGTHAFEDTFAECIERVTGGQLVIPVLAEQIEVRKRHFERERLRLTTSVASHDETFEVPRVEEELSVNRIAVGRVVESATGPRQVGETLIVPVYEEKVVLVKQLILKEELHIKRTRRESHETRRVSLRREQVEVEPVQSHDLPGQLTQD